MGIMGMSVKSALFVQQEGSISLLKGKPNSRELLQSIHLNKEYLKTFVYMVGSNTSLQLLVHILQAKFVT